MNRPTNSIIWSRLLTLIAAVAAAVGLISWVLTEVFIDRVGPEVCIGGSIMLGMVAGSVAVNATGEWWLS